MSEQIPESVPTSISRPSQRPIKKLRATHHASTDQQAAQISSLMLNPDLPLTIPAPPTSASQPAGYIPPEIVANVQGSSAGAGSGEFHVYKASRRREYARIQGMEQEAKKEEDDKKWEEDREERQGRDEKEREKNRAKRAKKKERKGKGKNGGMDADKAGDGGGGEGGEGVIGSQKRKTGGPLRGSGLRNELREEKSDKAGGANVQSVEVAEENGIVIHDDD